MSLCERCPASAASALGALTHCSSLGLMLAGCPSPVRLGGVIGVKCALRLPRLRRVARRGQPLWQALAREPVSSAGPRGIFLDLFYASLALISGLVIAGRAGRAV